MQYYNDIKDYDYINYHDDVYISYFLHLKKIPIYYLKPHYNHRIYVLTSITRLDTLHTLTRAGLSAIPSLGGPAVEIFNAIFTPPLNKRKDEWIQSIVKSLIELEGKVDGLTLENLSKNEVFITTVTQATYTAIRNHHEEKLTALRNAVINSALPNPPNEDLQLMFIT